MNNQDLLSNGEYNQIKSIVAQAVDLEFTRISNESQQQQLLEHLLELYYTQHTYSFFVLVNLKELTTDIYDHVLLRDFVLDITDRVSINLATSDVDLSKLINTIATGVCGNKINTSVINYSLVNPDVNNSLYINADTLKSCLHDNYWLIVVFLSVVFFSETQIYQNLVNSKPT